ncbi:bifunctional epoxide hydrolase 2, partial [Phtheirospermum japonicum]
LSARGYRAIALDLRGYGDSDAPPCASNYTAFHIIGDLVGLLDALGLDRVFLVGHDWGAVMAWYFCLIRPDRIRALVNMSAAFQPSNPKRKPVKSMRAILGDDYYICRFQVLFCACFFYLVTTARFLVTTEAKTTAAQNVARNQTVQPTTNLNQLRPEVKPDSPPDFLPPPNFHRRVNSIIRHSSPRRFFPNAASSTPHSCRRHRLEPLPNRWPESERAHHLEQ